MLRCAAEIFPGRCAALLISRSREIAAQAQFFRMLHHASASKRDGRA